MRLLFLILWYDVDRQQKEQIMKKLIPILIFIVIGGAAGNVC